MQIRFNARRSFVSGLILASVACGDSGGGSSKDKCEEDDSCDADGGTTKDAATEASTGDGGLLSASCSNGTKDGDETDLDCGGGCNPCGEGLMCKEAKDCAPLGCSASGICAKGNTPGFTISGAEGVVPVIVSVTSTATKGDGAEIAKTEYSWGEGEPFVEGATHKYRKGGTFAVRQRVTDAAGVQITSEPQMITLTDFAPVRFSEAMADKNLQIGLSADRYEASIKFDSDEAHAVRSDGTVAPASGVFYFEAESLVPVTDDDHSSIGVGTSAHPLDKLVAPRGTAMAPSPSFGVNMNDGAIETTGGQCFGVVVQPTPGPTQDLRTLVDRDRRRFAFVVDYRAATNPTIYALVPKADDTLELRRQCVLPTNAPLHIIFSGKRSVLGSQMRINTGADITNRPFHYTPAQVTAGLQTVQSTGIVPPVQMGTPAPADLAAQIQWGFGKTRTPMKDEPPALTVSADLTVAVNTPVNLTASATDVEDGDLTSQIAWTDISSQFHTRRTGKGGTFSFTPDRVGRYPIEVKVTDLDEVSTVKTITVTVTGTLPALAVGAVRLVPTPGVDAASPNYIQVAPNGLSVVRQGTTKNGARANQPLYQGPSNIWYFEATRVGVAANLAAGLVIGGGQLNPYSDAQVPWSMSLNMQVGIWRNLNAVTSWDLVDTLDDAIPANDIPNTVYGFVVDYRGVHPKVHVIVGNATQPLRSKIEYSTELTEIWEPVYPMLYGTVGGAPMTTEANTTANINFGATPFVFPLARINELLGSAGPLTAAQYRWGN